MLTKIVAGGFLLIMLGAVVIGAITLFTDREAANAQHAGAYGRGQDTVAGPNIDGRGTQGAGQGQGWESRETDSQQGIVPETAPQNGYGRGQGLGRGQGAEAPLAHAAQEIEGVVIETTELFIETHSGETVHVGLGPSHYRDGQGFVLSIGDNIQVFGYWEDDEFKAIQVTNLDSGDHITLRDASGRPMWAGQGRGQNRG